ncbi:MAG: ATP-binding protein [Acidimicrobiales bacterium]
MELEIPARPEFVSLARLVVSNVAALPSHPISTERVDDLCLAVSEAATNAIEAHRAAQTNERVTVRCRAEDGSLQVDVVDRGRGFDPASLPLHPPVTDPARLEFERGLGIPLIRALVDEVAFSDASPGTQVRLVIRAEALDIEVNGAEANGAEANGAGDPNSLPPPADAL